MKLNIFRTTVNEGNFSKSKNLHPNLTPDQIDELIKLRIKKMNNDLGLNIQNSIILSEKNKEMKARTITPTTKKLKEGIAILKSKNSEVEVLVETSDEPVIVASAKDVCAVGLATIENINNNMIYEMIEGLIKETNCAPFEMTFYITPCPSQDNYILDNIDNLKAGMWKDTYKKEKNKYHLDIRYAIYNLLLKEIVDPHYIYFDQKDPVENEMYYSKLGNKPGKNLVCVVFNDEENL